MAIKVMLLTQWFEPEPALKGISFARELIKQGFEVEVVTGFPNYPGGKLYPGYKMRWIQREIIDGVNVTRLPLYPSHDCSGVKRAINYASFAASSLIYGLFKAKRPDVIYTYHPPVTVGLTALIVRFIRRVPVVYDVQDMWPDTLSVCGMLNNKILLRIVGSVCSLIYRHVDKIVVLSPGFKQLLIDRGVAADKIQIIYNWCNNEALDCVETTHSMALKAMWDNKFCVMYAGNMGPGQGICSVVDVAEKLMSLRSDIGFVLLGSGIEIELIKSKIKDKNISNVTCIPPVSMNEVGAYLKAADVLLVHLKDDPLFRITIPSKTQAYMSIGKPVLMAVSGDAAELVEKADCGVVALSEDIDSIMKAVIRLADLSEIERQKMGANGQKYYFEKLALPIGVEHFSAEFRALCC